MPVLLLFLLLLGLGIIRHREDAKRTSQNSRAHQLHHLAPREGAIG
jgi:Tfp pilus assembly protein PilX